MELPEQGATPGPTEEGEPGIDFAYFRGLHSGATEKLTSLCQVWEGKNSSLEAADAEEEVTEEGEARGINWKERHLVRKKYVAYPWP